MTKYLLLDTEYLRLNLVVDILNNALHRFGERLISARTLQLVHSFRQPIHLRRYRGQGFRERVINLLGVGDDHALPFSKNDVSGHTNHGGIVRHTAQHDRSRAYPAVASYRDVA